MRKLILICAAALMFVMPGTTGAQDASISADFQPVVNGTITIAEVRMPVDGFLVIRLPKNRKPMYGKTLFVIPLKAGTHQNLQAKLNSSVKPGATLAIMLHTDTDTKGKYEFVLGKKADMPVFIGRRPVIAVIGITD